MLSEKTKPLLRGSESENIRDGKITQPILLPPLNIPARIFKSPDISLSESKGLKYVKTNRLKLKHLTQNLIIRLIKTSKANSKDIYDFYYSTFKQFSQRK
jgi:hypothetical protein